MHHPTTEAPPSLGAGGATRIFAGRPNSVAQARRWVAGFLAEHPCADAAVVMTSELVTNAIVHSASGLPGGLVTVKITMADGSVRVDVIDEGKASPRPPPPDALHAGIAIICELADAFGIDGQNRWFTLTSHGE